MAARGYGIEAGSMESSRTSSSDHPISACVGTVGGSACISSHVHRISVHARIEACISCISSRALRLQN